MRCSTSTTCPWTAQTAPGTRDKAPRTSSTRIACLRSCACGACACTRGPEKFIRATELNIKSVNAHGALRFAPRDCVSCALLCAPCLFKSRCRRAVNACIVCSGNDDGVCYPPLATMFARMTVRAARLCGPRSRDLVTRQPWAGCAMPALRHCTAATPHVCLAHGYCYLLSRRLPLTSLCMGRVLRAPARHPGVQCAD